MNVSKLFFTLSIWLFCVVFLSTSLLISTSIKPLTCAQDHVWTIQKSSANRSYVDCALPIVCDTNPGCHTDDSHECSSFEYLYAIDLFAKRNVHTCCKLKLPLNYYVTEICYQLDLIDVFGSVENIPKPGATPGENSKLESNLITNRQRKPSKQLVKSIVSTKNGPMVIVCEIVCQKPVTEAVVDTNRFSRSESTA